MDNILL